MVIVNRAFIPPTLPQSPEFKTMTAQSSLFGNPFLPPLPSSQCIRFIKIPQLDLKLKAVLQREGGKKEGRRKKAVQKKIQN